jgi:1-aminocyclopropane-1-carboxylate deaminase/D-cysteine desulfhydrase-like pyridoxal-dependent ACC family enzyme
MKFKIPSPLQQLSLPLFLSNEVSVFVKRDDLIHSEISGNKWRKLNLNLLHALENNYKGILTFGGAHSNHLSATAFVGKQNGLKTIAIVRGDANVPMSETLLFCEDNEMQLIFESRENYRKRNDVSYLRVWQQKHPDYFIIPEGGANTLGVKGCEEIISEIEMDFDFITVDCGTGATLAGMVKPLKRHQKAIGVQVLKGRDFITDEVLKFSPNCIDKFEVWTEYHFGGYAKYTDELLDFMRWFYAETAIKLDPVYTGKQFFAVFGQIKKGYFPKGATIVLTHTGGLQGISGFEKRYGVQIY